MCADKMGDTQAVDNTQASWSEIERIERAAIDFDDVVWSVPAPGRHHDVMAYILTECPGYEHVGGEQGFVTNRGRFVGREEARLIAEAAGQIIASCTDADGVAALCAGTDCRDRQVARQSASRFP